MATRKKLKPITEQSMEELNAAIAIARNAFPMFYVLLHGIDAYMERRRRWREEMEARRSQADYDDAMASFNQERSWGNS